MSNIKPKIGDWALFKEDTALPNWHRSMMSFASKLVQVTSVNEKEKTIKFEGSFIYKYYWDDIKELIPDDQIEEYKKRFTPTKENIYNLAVKIFGVDFVDLQGNNLIIHFPEINITNSKKYKHTIRDIFVKFSLQRVEGDFHYPAAPQGMKTTFLPEEILAGYVHSHLHSGHYSFNNFCLGSSQFAIIVTGMRNNYKNRASWEFLFRSLKPYLEWESLEGGPYIDLTRLNSAKNDYGKPKKSLDSQDLAILRNITDDCFEFQNDAIILNNREFYNFLDVNSKIRSFESSDNQALIDAGKRQIESVRNSVTFKGKEFKTQLVYEEVKKEQKDGSVKSPLDQNVYNQYQKSIQSHLSNYKTNLIKNYVDNNFSRIRSGQSRVK